MSVDGETAFGRSFFAICLSEHSRKIGRVKLSRAVEGIHVSPGNRLDWQVAECRFDCCARTLFQ
jgi:hypothetical protein